MRVHVNVYVRACSCERVCVYMHVCTCLCMYARTHACMYIRFYVCGYACTDFFLLLHFYTGDTYTVRH